MIAHSLTFQGDRFYIALKAEKCLAVFDTENVVGRIQDLYDLIQERSKNTIKIISCKIMGISEIFCQCLASSRRKRQSVTQKFLQ